MHGYAVQCDARDTGARRGLAWCGVAWRGMAWQGGPGGGPVDLVGAWLACVLPGRGVLVPFMEGETEPHPPTHPGLLEQGNLGSSALCKLGDSWGGLGTPRGRIHSWFLAHWGCLPLCAWVRGFWCHLQKGKLRLPLQGCWWGILGFFSPILF